MGRTQNLAHSIASLPTLRGLRRALNSSPLIPGAVRELIGGFAWSSGDYRVIGTDEVARAKVSSSTGWHRDRVAKRQAALWSEPTERADRVDVRNLKEALTHAVGRTVLEVGCGPAYNATYIDDRFYLGLDSSLAQLGAANHEQPLFAGDVTQLPVASRSVDIVIDGGTLMHVPFWEVALAQECRVARHTLILHTLSVTDSSPTTFLTKRAYGYTVPEVAFARADVVAALATHGFTIVTARKGIDYDLNDVIGIATSSETWVCQRGPHEGGTENSPNGEL